MRLDELKYSPTCSMGSRGGGLWAWKNFDGTYDIRDARTEGPTVIWDRLDPITAQAVLFELTKPCPVADPS